MAELKTKQTAASVPRFIAGVADVTMRKDCATLVKLMRRVTGASAAMWGTSIVGFGSYDYTYATGRTGTWPLVGFSPRRQNLTIYIMAGFARHAALMKKLGRWKGGKSCLYLRSLADVDLAVLEELVSESVAHMRRRYPAVATTTVKPRPTTASTANAKKVRRATR